MMILTEENQENEISFDYAETDFNEVLRRKYDFFNKFEFCGNDLWYLGC